MFAGEPFADITGPFGLTQAQEINSSSLDLPMTTSSIALQIRMARATAGSPTFLAAQRRHRTCRRSATYAFIGGFNDTRTWRPRTFGHPSGRHRRAHTQQAFISYMDEPEIEPRTGRPKHSSKLPSSAGSTPPTGHDACSSTMMFTRTIHAAMAETRPKRSPPSKGFRVDSGDLAELGGGLAVFEGNELRGLMPVLTGDLDAEGVRRTSASFPKPPIRHRHKALRRSAANRGVISNNADRRCPTLKFPTRRRIHAAGLPSGLSRRCLRRPLRRRCRRTRQRRDSDSRRGARRTIARTFLGARAV